MWLLHNVYQLLIALNIIFQTVTSLPSDDLSNVTTPVLNLGNQCSNLPATNVISFRALIEDKCYVDKTQFLSKFIVREEDDISPKSFFLARPRRFGKSMLIDTMSEFFQGDKQLFKDTYIGKHHTSWIQYPVIRLDFSRGLLIDTAEGFKADLLFELQEIAQSYKINLKAPSPLSAIAELIRKLKNAKKSPVVVLIDEYDSPYTRAYWNDKTEAQKILSLLHSFFSTLKGDDNIHFSFMTGVTRLSMDNFFSGHNAITDLTMDSEYPAIAGFTEEELRDYFGDFIENVATIKKKEATAILEVMKERHNGFQFSCADVQVYSPCSVITYLNSKGKTRNGWSETGGSGSFLNEKMKEFKEAAVWYLLENQSKDGVTWPIVATARSLAGKTDYTTKDETSFQVFLFHSGYFSIKSCEGESRILRFSNKELLDDYGEHLSYVLYEEYKEEKWVTGLRSMKEDLIYGRWEDFIIKLGSFYANVPYFMTMYQKQYKEAWFQFLLNEALYFAGFNNKPVMEDICNKGRADIIFIELRTTFIFETKYYDNKENALEQCQNKYVQKHILLSQRNVVCIGLQFSKERDIMRWGVATYSGKGELLQQYGPQEEDKRYRLEVKTSCSAQP